MVSGRLQPVRFALIFEPILALTLGLLFAAEISLTISKLRHEAQLAKYEDYLCSLGLSERYGRSSSHHRCKSITQYPL